MSGIDYPPYPCAICGRQWRGFRIETPKLRGWFCSFECSEVAMKYRSLDITKNETTAALAGGKEAGAFLEQIGKTDLAAMTKEEWEKFCGTLFAAACADLARQADEHIPF